MKIKPFARSGAVLLYLCIFVCMLLAAACGGGKKPDQPGDQPRKDQAEEASPKGGVYGNGDGSNEGRMISRAEADSMINMYTANKKNLLEGNLKNDTLVLPDYEEFSKEMMSQILNQDGVTGVRIYFCMDSISVRKIKVLIVGKDKEGKDLFYVGADGKTYSTAPSLILEEGNRRP